MSKRRGTEEREREREKRGLESIRFVVGEGRERQNVWPYDLGGTYRGSDGGCPTPGCRILRDSPDELRARLVTGPMISKLPCYDVATEPCRRVGLLLVLSSPASAQPCYLNDGSALHTHESRGSRRLRHHFPVICNSPFVQLRKSSF